MSLEQVFHSDVAMEVLEWNKNMPLAFYVTPPASDCCVSSIYNSCTLPDGDYRQLTADGT
ncbi:hypothetical protein [Sodalis sp.]|uniref:hypothetical protein n=1 Tax=Sodalis sp. (in: enterobacteria) TaxID=1898979 RepID=UPI0038739BE2